MINMLVVLLVASVGWLALLYDLDRRQAGVWECIVEATIWFAFCLCSGALGGLI